MPHYFTTTSSNIVTIKGQTSGHDITDILKINSCKSVDSSGEEGSIEVIINLGGKETFCIDKIKHSTNKWHKIAVSSE